MPAASARALLTSSAALTLALGVPSAAHASLPVGLTRPSSPLGAAATASAAPLALSTCLAQLQVRCYGARALRHAYRLDRLGKAHVDGGGTTIAIIGTPATRLRESLALQSRSYGLPPARLVIAAPAGDPGRTTPLGVIEASLDVEMAHLAAPRATLLFLAVPNPSIDAAVLQPTPVARAVDAAIASHADVISMSFGGLERRYRAMRAALVRAAAAGIPVVASSGDSGVATPGFKGRQPDYPATDPNVTAIGGTLLTLDAGGTRLLPDLAWGPDIEGGASGGGVSRLDPRPSWQRHTTGTSAAGRSYPDISMAGAISGGVVLALAGRHARDDQFFPVGGTSVSAPLFAGVLALARQRAGRPLARVNQHLYALARSGRRKHGITDVILGNNSYGTAKDGTGRGPFVHGYLARQGYDLVTGLGTIDAPVFVDALAHAVRAAQGRATTRSVSG